MRYKTRNIRRATQDLDLDFIKYSLSERSIDLFIEKINCISGVHFIKVGNVEELRQEDYHGKRVFIKIQDDFGNALITKVDFGVHNKLNVIQEEFCFDIALNESGVSLLVNSNEQMFVEKLKSLLKFGVFSTRYKDVFDMYYFIDKLNKDKIEEILETYIFNDVKMKEENAVDITKRIENIFKNKNYRKKIETSEKNWLNIDVEVVFDGLIQYINSLDKVIIK